MVRLWWLSRGRRALGSLWLPQLGRAPCDELDRDHRFASQFCILGQGSHTARPKRSLFDHSQKGSPLFIARNPGQGLETRDQYPLTTSSKRLARRVSSSTNRVICAFPSSMRKSKNKRTAVSRC